MTCTHVDAIRIGSRTPAFELPPAGDAAWVPGQAPRGIANPEIGNACPDVRIEGPDMGNACPALLNRRSVNHPDLI